MLALTLVSSASAQPDLRRLQRILRDEVEFLCDTLNEGRAFGQKGKFFSTSYTVTRFRDAGLVPLGDGFIHSFDVLGRRGRNVIGFRQGSLKDRYVIVASYSDGLGRLAGNIYPGADSNASGMAALLTLADTLKAGGLSVIFVAFDARNASMAGSYNLWQELASGQLRNPEGRPIRPSQIAMMVNIDIIGSTLAPVHPRWPEFVIAMSSQEDYLNILLTNSRKGLGLRVERDYYGSKDFTRLFYRKIGDQRVFVEHGIPCVVWTSGITNNTNKVEDLPSTLDYPVFASRVELIRAWLQDWVIK